MTPTLLLADDSVTIQRVIELTFANENIRVVSTGDGEAALRHLATERPDIVLADVGMPKMDGYDVASHIKQTPTLRDIPVLLLTGAFEPIDEARARASGCDGILVKPFEPQQLVGRVRELLAGAHTAALWPANLPTAESRPAAPMRPFLSVAPKAEPVGPAATGASGPPGPASASRPVAVPAATSPPATDQTPASVQTTSPPPATPLPPLSGLAGSFQREFEQLDTAFADLDSETAALGLDKESASDFARDLDHFRRVESPAVARPFGDWDLPKPPPQADSDASVEQPDAAASGAWDLSTSDAATPHADPSAALAPAPLELPAAEPPTPARTKVSIASAFSALLAAEQSQPRTAARPDPAPALSEAAVEEVVRRVLARMTAESVHRIVLETAERLIKEELEKIRANPT